MFPSRSKVSDGGIGDAAHQANSSSDHNPHVRDSKGGRVVTARDFTFDNNPSDGVGVDCHWLAAALVASRDPRIKYIIWNGRIISSKQQPWQWRSYHGKNPHKHHLHLSVMAGEKLFDDVSEWDLTLDLAATEKPTAELNFFDLRRGSKGEAVRQLQERLRLLGLLDGVDGDFGHATEKAVRNFQYSSKLRVDGIVGPNTAKILGLTK